MRSLTARAMLFGVALGTMSVVHAKMAPSKTVMVGGAPMYPTKDIIDNAVSSKDHTTLVTAVKAAGLVETLKGRGPFTVFAPTNAAFAKLPAATVDNLLKPESKGTLVSVLSYHVVLGALDSKTIAAAIKAGGGKASFETLQGEHLTAIANGGSFYLVDAHGGKSMVSCASRRPPKQPPPSPPRPESNSTTPKSCGAKQQNGEFYSIDTVLAP